MFVAQMLAIDSHLDCMLALPPLAQRLAVYLATVIPRNLLNEKDALWCLKVARNAALQYSSNSRGDSTVPGL